MLLVKVMLLSAVKRVNQIHNYKLLFPKDLWVELKAHA